MMGTLLNLAAVAGAVGWIAAAAWAAGYRAANHDQETRMRPKADQ